MPVRIDTPTGALRLAKSNSQIQQRLFRNGSWERRIFDLQMRLLEHQTKGAKPARLSCDKLRTLDSVQHEAGVTRYAVDESNLTLTVTFPGG